MYKVCYICGQLTRCTELCRCDNCTDMELRLSAFAKSHSGKQYLQSLLEIDVFVLLYEGNIVGVFMDEVAAEQRITTICSTIASMRKFAYEFNLRGIIDEKVFKIEGFPVL